MSIEFKCPSCGKKLFTYEYRIRKYGSPLKECKKCGSEYIDPRYYELALDGIPDDEFKITPYVFMMIIGGLIIWRGLYMFRMHQLGVAEEIQWLLPTVFTLLGIVLVIGSIAGMVSIKTGLHKKKIDRLMAESRARVSDMDYIRRLRKLGYKIDDGFGGFSD